MKISFVGHACILLETGPVRLLMDPWLHGEAFNDSWALHPQPVLSEEKLASVTHLWISHEHPDHLSMSTLQAIPKNMRSRITALFQKYYSEEIKKILTSLGFKEVIELPRARFFPLAPEVQVYCRQVGHVDSSLAVRAEDKLVLNVNDCELPASTMRSMRRDLGAVDVLLDQFSLAGWPGNADDTPRKEQSRQRMMHKLLQDIEILKPRYVIPFASFIRFCHQENAHMNPHVNTVDDVARHVDASQLAVMYPGDVWDMSVAFTGTARAMQRYREDFGRTGDLPLKSHDPVPMEKLVATVDKRLRDMRLRYQSLLLRWFPAVTFYLEDLQRALEVDVRRGVREVALARSDCMVRLSSQAMWYTFAYRWGLPTLGVSGRMSLDSRERPFGRLKKLGALYSAKVFTREPASVLNRRLLGYLWERRGDLYSQYVRRVI